MKLLKGIFEVTFIFSIAAVFLLLNHFNLIEKLNPFIFIPIYAAYKIGQYSEKKFKSS
jgi:hypothetical protein